MAGDPTHPTVKIYLRHLMFPLQVEPKLNERTADFIAVIFWWGIPTGTKIEIVNATRISFFEIERLARLLGPVDPNFSRLLAAGKGRRSEAGGGRGTREGGEIH